MLTYVTYCNEVKRMKRGQIYNKIVGALNTGSLNIQQISNKTGIRWETVKNAVDALTEGGFLVKNGKYYSIKKDFSFDEETLLGIPISQEKKQQIAAIANRIKKLKNYKNTFLQKAVVEVIKKNDLDLPYGWYLYGPCSALNLNNDILNNYPSTTKYDKSIKETISEFDGYKNTDDLMEKYYIDEPVYYARLQIDQIFKEKLTKNSMRQIELALKQMLLNIKEPAYYFLDSFLSSVSMLKKLSEEEINDIKLEVYSTFKTIWEIVGTQYLKNTLKVNNGDFYYESRISTLQSIAHCYLLRLKDYWPEPQFTEHIEKMRKKYSK